MFYRNASSTRLWSHDHNYNITSASDKDFVTSWPGIVTSLPLFQNKVILKRAEEVTFADIIKSAHTLIIAAFKNSMKVKKAQIICQNAILNLYLLI